MRRSQSFMAATALCVAFTLLVLGGLAAAALASIGRIPDGNGTATVTWTAQSTLHPTSTVGGSIGRYRVKATGTVPFLEHQGGTTGSNGLAATFASVKGTLSGTPFVINISLSFGSTAGQPHSFATVTGTFHGVRVSATIDEPTTQAQLRTDLGTFSGTIGSQHVRGTIFRPKTKGGKSTAHATYVVTG